MFRSDGQPWWSVDVSNAAKASIAKIPTVGAFGVNSGIGKGAFGATGFALAATDCWLQALGEVNAFASNAASSSSSKSGAAGAHPAPSDALLASCRALLRLAPPLATSDDAFLFVNSLFDLFSRTAQRHASACGSTAAADAAGTRVLLAIARALIIGDGEAVTDGGNDNNNISMNTAAGSGSISNSSAKGIAAAVRVLTAAGVPHTIHREHAAFTNALRDALAALAAEVSGLAAAAPLEGAATAASEETLNAFVGPRAAEGWTAAGSSVTAAAAAKDEAAADVVAADPSALRGLSFFFTARAEAVRGVAEPFSEFVFAFDDSVDNNAAVDRLDGVTMALHSLTSAVAALSVASSSSAFARGGAADDADGSPSVGKAYAELASSVLKGLSGSLSERLPRLRRAVLARLSEVPHHTLRSSSNQHHHTAKRDHRAAAAVDGHTSSQQQQQPVAVASSLTALLVGLSKLELALAGTALHPLDGAAHRRHPQPYSSTHPLRKLHTKALLLQQTSPIATYGGPPTSFSAGGGNSASVCARGVDLLCRAAVVPSTASLVGPSSSSSAVSSSHDSSLGAVAAAFASAAAAEMTAVKGRRTVNASATAAAATDAQQQQFCPKALAASVLWQNPVASWCSIFSAVATAASAAGPITASARAATSSAAAAAAAAAPSTSGTIIATAAASSASPKQLLAPSRASLLYLANGGASDRHTARQTLWYQREATASLPPSVAVAVGSGAPLLFFLAMLEAAIGNCEGSSDLGLSFSSSSADASASLITDLKQQSVLLLAASAMDAALLCLGRHTSAAATLLAIFCACEGLVPASSGSRGFFPLLQAYFGVDPTNADALDHHHHLHHLSPERRPYLASAVAMAEAAIVGRGEYSYLAFLLGPLVSLGVAKAGTFGALTPFAGGTAASALAITSADSLSQEGRGSGVLGTPPPQQQSAAATGTSSSSTAAAAGTAPLKKAGSVFLPTDDAALWAPTLTDLSDVSAVAAAAVAAALEAPSAPYFSRYAAPNSHSAAFTSTGSIASSLAEDALLFVRAHLDTIIRCAAEAAVYFSAAKQRTIALDSSPPAVVDGAAELFFGLLHLLAAPMVDLSPPTSAFAYAPNEAAINAHKLYTLRSLEAAIEGRCAAAPYATAAPAAPEPAAQQGGKGGRGGHHHNQQQQQQQTPPTPHAFLFWAHMAACEFKVLTLSSSASSDGSSSAAPLRREPSFPIPTPLMRRAMAAVPTPFARDPLAFVEVFGATAVDVVPVGTRRRALAALTAAATARCDKAGDIAALLAVFEAAVPAGAGDDDDTDQLLPSNPSEASSSSLSVWGSLRKAQHSRVECVMRRLGLTAHLRAAEAERRPKTQPPSTPPQKPSTTDKAATPATGPNGSPPYMPCSPPPSPQDDGSDDGANDEAGAPSPLTLPPAEKGADVAVDAASLAPHSITTDPNGADTIADAWRSIKSLYIHRNALVAISALDNFFKALLLKATLSPSEAIGAAYLLLAFVKYDKYAALRTFEEVEEEEEEAAAAAERAAREAAEAEAKKAEEAAKKDKEEPAGEGEAEADAAITEEDDSSKVEGDATAVKTEAEDTTAVVTSSAATQPAATAKPTAAAAIKAAASHTPMHVQVQRRLSAALLTPLAQMLHYATATEAEGLSTFAALVVSLVLLPWANQQCQPNAPLPNPKTSPAGCPAIANPLTLCAPDALFPMLPACGADTSDEVLEKLLRDVTAAYELCLPKFAGAGAGAAVATAIGGAAAPVASASGAPEAPACASVNALVIKSTCRRLFGLLRLHRKLSAFAEEGAMRNAAATSSPPASPAPAGAGNKAAAASVHKGLVPTVTYVQHMAIVAAHCRSVEVPPPVGRAESFSEAREMLPHSRIFRLRHLANAANVAAHAHGNAAAAGTANNNHQQSGAGNANNTGGAKAGHQQSGAKATATAGPAVTRGGTQHNTAAPTNNQRGAQAQPNSNANRGNAAAPAVGANAQRGANVPQNTASSTAANANANSGTSHIRGGGRNDGPLNNSNTTNKDSGSNAVKRGRSRSRSRDRDYSRDRKDRGGRDWDRDRDRDRSRDRGGDRDRLRDRDRDRNRSRSPSRDRYASTGANDRSRDGGRLGGGNNYRSGNANTGGNINDRSNNNTGGGGGRYNSNSDNGRLGGGRRDRSRTPERGGNVGSTSNNNAGNNNTNNNNRGNYNDGPSSGNNQRGGGNNHNQQQQQRFDNNRGGNGGNNNNAGNNNNNRRDDNRRDTNANSGGGGRGFGNNAPQSGGNAGRNDGGGNNNTNNRRDGNNTNSNSNNTNNNNNNNANNNGNSNRRANDGDRKRDRSPDARDRSPDRRGGGGGRKRY